MEGREEESVLSPGNTHALCGALGPGGCAPQQLPEAGRKTQPGPTERHGHGHGPSEGQRRCRPPSQPRVGRDASRELGRGWAHAEPGSGSRGCRSPLVKRLPRMSFTDLLKVRRTSAHRARGQPPGAIRMLTEGPEKP